MPNRSIFLAGAAGLALVIAPAASQAQQSWGNSTTTYWNLPETGNPAFGKDFSASAMPPSAPPPADTMQYQPTGTERMQPGMRKPMTAKKQAVQPKMRQGQPAKSEPPARDEAPKSGTPTQPGTDSQ